MRSLALKLTLAFLLVGILVIALVGVFVGVRTRDAFNLFAYDRDITSLAQVLENYYASNGSWRGVESVFLHNRFSTMPIDWQRTSAAILDKRRNVVLGYGAYRLGSSLGPREVARGVGLEVDGERVGWLIIEQKWPMPPARSPEEAMLVRIRRAIILGAVGAIGLALVLGIILAQGLARPIRELTEATRAIARGQLGRQVPIRSQDELGELANSFNQMSADLSRTTEARRQMTADVAHELRTPLSVILGYTEALQDGKLRDHPETYRALHETALQLQHLVDDLRTLALADAGELSLTRRPVDPRALLERAALAYMAQAESAGVSLEIDAAPNLPVVDVDPERISQVLSNLVSNALRYTPAGGRIVLSAAAPGGEVSLLCVRDTGTGISSEDLPYVFDRFYRGDKSRSQQHGESGLGLAIARSIVESHGGRLEVESVAGKGTTFTLRLSSRQM